MTKLSETINRLLFVTVAIAVPIRITACTDQLDPELPGQICAAAETLPDAQALLRSVLDEIDGAQEKVTATQALIDASLGAREAFDSGRYSEAVADASAAIRELETLGFDVPPEVPKNLGRAEALLTMAGR